VSDSGPRLATDMPSAPHETLRTLVVVPTYVEAPNIPELLERIRAAAPLADVLIVDDSSPDGTADTAREIAKKLGRVEVVVRPVKNGLGNAYRFGFDIGVTKGYEAIVQMDADLSHDPASIPTLLEALDNGADLAIGSRYVPGGRIPHWPWHRRTASRLGNLYTRAALRVDTRDLTSGFRAWRTSALRCIDFQSTKANGYLFAMEMARRTHDAGLKIAEVPITFTDRVRGNSKMSGAVIFEELTHVTLWGIRDRWKRLRHRG
jgi:dolichol-phosphate mannosyltransferase